MWRHHSTAAATNATDDDVRIVGVVHRVVGTLYFDTKRMKRLDNKISIEWRMVSSKHSQSQGRAWPRWTARCGRASPAPRRSTSPRRHLKFEQQTRKNLFKCCRNMRKLNNSSSSSNLHHEMRKPGESLCGIPLSHLICKRMKM